MDLRGSVEEAKRSGIIQSTSKRVRMIFSVMASPNRIDILRILNSKGPMTYSDLKALAGFRSKKESGKFAYHLRKLLRQSLVALNKSERRYTITNLGKLVLNLARQIEERSIIESGKLYVRTSHESIDEFNTHKIIQSLVREGDVRWNWPKVTEEVETRVYKYQTTYLTGSLIREMVNSVLLEQGHEGYRNKLARMGLPVFDIQEMLTNLDNVNSGAEGLLFNTGQSVFAEYLLSNILPKDVADAHISGDLHITNIGVWSMIPDTIFANIKDILSDGVDPGGKHIDVSRIPHSKHLHEMVSALSIMIMLLSKEASQEVVLDGITQLFAKHSKSPSDLEQALTSAFVTASASSRYSRTGTYVSFKLHLGTDAKIIQAVIGAYRNYARITPLPKIGLIISHEKGKLSDVSRILAEIISVGGRVLFAKSPVSSGGVINPAAKNSDTLALTLQSISINLPRLAFESNKDETYFRARLALLMKPMLSSIALRKKEITDLTRRGLNPILAKNTQYMQRCSVSFVVNLIGLHEAVFNILGYQNNREGKAVLQKVIDTAMDVAAKKGKDFGDPVLISLTETDGTDRFAALDGEKYGKNSVVNIMAGDKYSQGLVLNSADVSSYTPKSDPISECNKLAKILNGGLLVMLNIAKDASVDDIRVAIEKTAEMTPLFRPVKNVAICGECGYKSDAFEEKCPKCKSPYII